MVRHNSGRNTQASARVDSSEHPPPYSEQYSSRTHTTGNVPSQAINGPGDTYSYYGAISQTSHHETVLLIQGKKGYSKLGLLTYVLLAIGATFTVCSIMMPITWCNDPLDPGVRNRIRKEWDAEWHQHEIVAEKHRTNEIKWKEQEQAHERLTRRWEQERKDHERDIKERAKREEEERQKLNMFWVDVEPHGCTTYSTRTYSARLANVPSKYQRRVEACRATPLVVHGVSYMPVTCEDKGSHGIIGHWTVNQNEPDCVSYWDSYKDKGCTSKGSGKRRIEHHLANLPAGSKWKEFVETTPVTFHGLHFSGAGAASRLWTGAVYGQWEIDDAEC